MRERDRVYKQNVPYVVHNTDQYGKLPLCAAVEIMSFGILSMLYGNLDLRAGNRDDNVGAAAAIASSFGIKQRHLKSWTHHLVTVRNIAAHHDRFYNRMTNIQPTTLRQDACYSGSKQRPAYADGTQRRTFSGVG